MRVQGSYIHKVRRSQGNHRVMKVKGSHIHRGPWNQMGVTGVRVSGS